MEMERRGRRPSNNVQPSRLADLRRRAEQDLAAIGRPSPTLAHEDVDGLLYELQVHQIELEMQCRQLQESQQEAEESRNKYRELYESLPIGYATLDPAGNIVDLNPAGESLLGISATTPRPNFHLFITGTDVNRFDLLCREVLLKNEARTAKLLLERTDGVKLSAEMGIRPAPSSVRPRRLRVTFQDMTAKNTAEGRVKGQQTELERHHQELQVLSDKLVAVHEHEPRRFTSNLHDDPCQHLQSCIAEIEVLARRLDPDERERIEHISVRLKALVGNVRRVARDLTVPEAGTALLQESMRQYIEQLSRSSRLPIEFRERDVPVGVPQPIARCLFRLMQESLGNVIQHAQAKRAVVALSGSGVGIEMQVVDDGRGFDLTRVLRDRKGLGLASIQERVRSLGGKVVIQSQPGRGAELSVLIPLSAPGSAVFTVA